ncbi:hypothetical protein GE09DRAFT_1055891 [Coniochaeta sp. 2T2.1]|nr:hypothetical protein GE09DRAFT_1055891 [Coniochaeta sp. 2T2.1]
MSVFDYYIREHGTHSPPPPYAIFDPLVQPANDDNVSAVSKPQGSDAQGHRGPCSIATFGTQPFPTKACMVAATSAAVNAPVPVRDCPDRCWYDEITREIHGSAGRAYKRELRWEYHVLVGLRDYAPDRDISIQVYSDNAVWLAGLSRDQAMDLVSLGSSFRITGWRYRPNDPIHHWRLFFYDSRHPSEDLIACQLREGGGGLDIDDKNNRALVARRITMSLIDFTSKNNPPLAYALSSLHFPEGYHSNQRYKIAPWYAFFEIRMDYPGSLIEPFDWRGQANSCWHDKITPRQDHRSHNEEIYCRELRWDYHDEEGVLDMQFCIQLYSTDARRLADLSREEVMDHIILGTAVRVTGFVRLEDNPEHDWALFFLDFPNPFQLPLPDYPDGELDVDDRSLRNIMYRNYEKHLRHPDEAAPPWEVL